MSEQNLRGEIRETALEMARMGLSPQRSGNVSARFEDGFLVTPSGLRYEDTRPEDIVFVKADGTVPPGQRKPSSETPFHRAIYESFADARAITHCHSPAATAVACARDEIPAVHYIIAFAGGKKIPLADYATFGTEALADAAVNALSGYRACLLSNHGQIAYGADLTRARELADIVETMARLYLDLLAIGKMHILSDAEMDEVLEKFPSYGQQDV